MNQYFTSLEKFLAASHRRNYSRNSTIIFSGDQSDTIYYIVRGTVTVTKADPSDGREIILAYLSEGQFFGEMGLFQPEAPRSAWVKAKTQCEVAELSHAKFKSLAETDPGMLYVIGGQLVERLTRTTQKVRDLAFIDVSGRVARTLIDLARAEGAMTHPDGILIRTTRQELAKIVGCSREMVGRVLKNLEESGHLSVRGQSIVVVGERPVYHSPSQNQVKTATSNLANKDIVTASNQPSAAHSSTLSAMIGEE